MLGTDSRRDASNYQSNLRAIHGAHFPSLICSSYKHQNTVKGVHTRFFLVGAPRLSDVLHPVKRTGPTRSDPTLPPAQTHALLPTRTVNRTA